MAKQNPEALFDVKAPRLFSIDAGRPFLSDLADTLIELPGADLASAEIFLPNRRAASGAADAFLESAAKQGKTALLLPRFRAIGDIEEDDPDIFAGDAIDELDLAPAINSAERIVALARFVAARDRSFAGHDNWPAAVNAARELGKLLDSFYAEEVDPAALRNIDVGGFAEHWRGSLRFLEIIMNVWPAYLSEIGRMDPALRRSKLIGFKARRLAEAPPAHPIIIAGTTASAPAVARFLAASANAAMGVVILPGLDRRLDDAAWRSIDDAHPQSGLKRLLDNLGLDPEAVTPWPGSGAQSSRAQLLGLALRPAEATDEWLALVGDMTGEDPTLQSARDGLQLVEADNEEAEATIIAALFRKTLETPGATSMLVTPDRNLSRRVALKMKRWGVYVDDSAGVPFANSSCGTFLRLVALFLDRPGDPVNILALLRHPLSAAGLSPDNYDVAVEKIDRALRGVMPAGGLAGLRTRMTERKSETDNTRAILECLIDAAEKFRIAAAQNFSARIDAHIAAAESMAGAEIIWRGDDGAKGATIMADLKEADLDAFDEAPYGELFSAFIAGSSVYARSKAHPRLSIFGPLEARLLSADHVILGGLNEGVWPDDAEDDPFLSRRIRREIGLPSPERRIGLSAHDFAQMAAAPSVTLTRSRRSGGRPAKPSRWIVRLRNILEGGGALERVDASAAFAKVVANLDRPSEVTPVKRPSPKAGPGRRPEKLYVTQIEKWLRDPYSIYARHLLGLRKWEQPGEPFSIREMGVIFHETFAKAAAQIPAFERGALSDLFDEVARKEGLGADDRLFWSEAISQALQWFLEFDAERRIEGRAAIIEGKGSIAIGAIEPPFVLAARADRIDILNNGEAAIFDFKTGKIPTTKLEKSFSPQLPLTGLIVREGGFSPIGKAEVARYEYLKITGRKEDQDKNRFARIGPDAAKAIDEAEHYLGKLLRAFDDENTTYRSQPRPQFVDAYGDYDQLARRKEWGAASDDGEGDQS